MSAQLDHGSSAAATVTACITCAIVAIACEPVAIYGTLEVDGDPVLVAPGEGGLGSVAVGLLGEHVLVEWARLGPDDYTQVPTIRWLDGDLEPAGEVRELGLGVGYASRWVRDGDALVGQVWATPTFRTDLRADDWVHLWRMRPPPRESTYEQVQVAATIPPDELFGIIWLSTWWFGVGAEGALPLAAVGSRFVGALGVLPRECDDITLQRLATFTSDDLAGRSLPLPAGAPFCDRYAPQPGTPWLVGLDEGVGLLFRQGPIWDGEERVRFARLDEFGRLMGPPRVVGGQGNLSSVDGGNQPRGVSIGHRILFTERRGGENDCHMLVVMNDDGTGAGDAPWQLPCYAFPNNAWVPERRITASVELVAVPGGAVLVWSEHNMVTQAYITRDYPWDEGIYAVLLDSSGRRGSEVVRVTDPAATALSAIPRGDMLGPVERNLFVGAAAEGNRVAVVWYDNRAGAEGIYLRRLSFRPN